MTEQQKARLAELRAERADSAFPARALASNPDHTPGWWEDQYSDEAAELAALETVEQQAQTEDNSARRQAELQVESIAALVAALECGDRDDASDRIYNDPLSVEVRSDWATPGETMTATEFRIVLCTGGPHVELIGDLDEHCQPTRVRVLFRGWGESGELYDFDRDAVLTYCRQHYFGE